MHCVQFSIPYKSCLVGHTFSFILGFFTKRVSFFSTYHMESGKLLCCVVVLPYNRNRIFSALSIYIANLSVDSTTVYLCRCHLSSARGLFTYPCLAFRSSQFVEKKAPTFELWQTWYFLKKISIIRVH